MIEKQYFKKLNKLITKVIKETDQTKTSVAEKMGVSFQGLWDWCEKKIPGPRCHEFSIELHGIIPIDMLRPDIYLSKEDKKHVDFGTNKTLILQRLETWKSEQPIKT